MSSYSCWKTDMILDKDYPDILAAGLIKEMCGHCSDLFCAEKPEEIEDGELP